MKSHLGHPELTPQETQIIHQLRQQPELLTRLQSILDLAHATTGPLKTADAIEALLIQELRQLGRTTMHQWATQAQDATVRGLKKTLTWWCVFGVMRVGERLWQSHSQRYLRPLPARLGVTPRGRSRRLELAQPHPCGGRRRRVDPRPSRTRMPRCAPATAT